MADDESKIEKPKGVEKAKARAEKANAAHDEAVEKGRKGGKLNLKVMRGTKGQGNRKGGK